MVKIFALDIDGVLTDGTVAFSASGDETKTVSYVDMDAVFEARRRGLEVVLITAEATPWADFIARRLEIVRIVKGAKDKKRALEELAAALRTPLSDICYVGDGDRDAAAIDIAGLGLAPANATPAAASAADVVLRARGGHGAVREALDLISQRQKSPPRG